MVTNCLSPRPVYAVRLQVPLTFSHIFLFVCLFNTLQLSERMVMLSLVGEGGEEVHHKVGIPKGYPSNNCKHMSLRQHCWGNSIRP